MKKLLIIYPAKGNIGIEENPDELLYHRVHTAIGGFAQIETPKELEDMGFQFIVNRDGVKKGLHANENLFPFFYVGNVVVTKNANCLDDSDVGYIMDWLKALEAER